MPGGAVDCSLFWQSEWSGGCLPPLVLVLEAMPGEAWLTVYSHRLCLHPLWGPWALPHPQLQSGSSRPSLC